MQTPFQDEEKNSDVRIRRLMHIAAIMRHHIKYPEHRQEVYGYYKTLLDQPGAAPYLHSLTQDMGSICSDEEREWLFQYIQRIIDTQPDLKERFNLYRTIMRLAYSAADLDRLMDAARKYLDIVFGGGYDPLDALSDVSHIFLGASEPLEIYLTAAADVIADKRLRRDVSFLKPEIFFPIADGIFDSLTDEMPVLKNNMAIFLLFRAKAAHYSGVDTGKYWQVLQSRTSPSAGELLRGKWWSQMDTTAKEYARRGFVSRKDWPEDNDFFRQSEDYDSYLSVLKYLKMIGTDDNGHEDHLQFLIMTYLQGQNEVGGFLAEYERYRLYRLGKDPSFFRHRLTRIHLGQMKRLLAGKMIPE